MREKLVGIGEIQARLGGISRQRVDQLTRRTHFPAPVADLRQGRIWAAADVEQWIAERRPHQGDLDG